MVETSQYSANQYDVDYERVYIFQTRKISQISRALYVLYIFFCNGSTNNKFRLVNLARIINHAQIKYNKDKLFFEYR